MDLGTTLTVSGALGGNGNFTKVGLGQLTSSAAGTLIGNTTIANGIVLIQNSFSLGLIAGGSVTVGSGANDGEKGEGDNVTKTVEIVFGGSGADKLTAGVKAAVLHGGSGNDTLTGGKGADYLDGGHHGRATHLHVELYGMGQCVDHCHGSGEAAADLSPSDAGRGLHCGGQLCSAVCRHVDDWSEGDRVGDGFVG